MISICWMRRDLRLHDHAALAAALGHNHPVQPVFVFDTDILARFTNPRDRRLTFIMKALCAIDVELKKRGGGLLVLAGKSTEIIPKLAVALKAHTVFSAEDFEPATIARDAAVKQALGASARFVQVIDHVLRAPYQIVKDDGAPLKVFTPFYKRWLASLSEMDWQEYKVVDAGRYANFEKTSQMAAQAGLRVLSLAQGAASALAAIGYSYVEDALWPVTGVAERLSNFTQTRLQSYGTARDFMAEEGTSRISPYLRHGLVSVRECVRAAKRGGGGEKWISELCWREFYMAILYHFPHVVTEEFAEHYRGDAIAWNRSDAVRDALTQAKTGFPIIDAALRELLQTGWMHNRARMIVASFFSKDLLMDWRIGEEFFAQHLMDYELASNNGGWQWSSSTGTDASPYFRIFNPWLQSKKFDPDGDYIRRYVPELAGLSKADIHEPHTSLFAPASYPKPIVDHAMARDLAIAMFRKTANYK